MAIAVLFSVNANLIVPSGSRYLMLARLACQSCSDEQLCVSR